MLLVSVFSGHCSTVLLVLCKEYFTLLIFKLAFLLQVNYWTCWYIDHFSTSFCTAVIHLKKWSSTLATLYNMLDNDTSYCCLFMRMDDRLKTELATGSIPLLTFRFRYAPLSMRVSMTYNSRLRTCYMIWELHQIINLMLLLCWLHWLTVKQKAASIMRRVETKKKIYLAIFLRVLLV